MSSGPVQATSENPPTLETTSNARPPLKMWLPIVVVILYWIAVECSFRFELGMFQRFIMRMYALLAMLAFFLIWGLSRRHFTWSQRFASLGIIVGGALIAGLLSDASVGAPVALMMGVPIALSLGTVIVALLRKAQPATKVKGIAVAALVAFIPLPLLRWDGLDGRQHALFSWRWQSKPEELFLATKTSVKSAEPSRAENLAGDQVQPIAAEQGDWTLFRGGAADAVLHDVQLGGDWNAEMPTELWRHRVGPGWSSVIAVGDLLFTQEQRGPQETVVCYNAGDGSEVWTYRSATDQRFEESLSGTGPRATPTFADGQIYAYGAQGHLCCLDAATGSPLWTHEVFAETGAQVPMWGSATSPLVVDDQVVVFAGGTDEQGLVAYSSETGDLKWKAAAGTISYCTPMLTTIDSVRQIVFQDDSGLVAVDPVTGKQLWEHTSPYAVSFQPMIQPHLIGDNRLVIGWDAGIMCLEVQHSADSWSTEELWTSNKMKPGFNDVVFHENMMYGLDDGILACFDLDTQKRRWKKGRYGYGQLLLLPEQNELLIVSEAGELVRASVDSKKLTELAKFEAIDGKTWNHPLIAHGRIVVRNGEEMACYELPTAK